MLRVVAPHRTRKVLPDSVERPVIAFRAGAQVPANQRFASRIGWYDACSALCMSNFALVEGAIIGETMRIKGEIFSRDELRIDGQVEGTLESQNRLTINSTGKADATIKAAEVVIAGTVNGNVEATQRIVLRKGANLVGDVKTAGIVIEDGAFFRGGIDITRPDVKAAAQS